MPQKRSAKTQPIPVHMRYVEYLDVAKDGFDRYLVQMGELDIDECWSSHGYVFYVAALDMAVTIFATHLGAFDFDELRELMPEDV